jgi:acetoacetyl-CoA synthetase
VWDYYGIIGEKGQAPLINKEASMLSLKDFVPRARLNYAENVLFGHPNAMSDCKLAIVDAFEPASSDATPIKRSLTFKSLTHEVNILSNAMRKLNVKPGDRIAAYSANNAETVISVLAATALGGVFTSVAAEMGPIGVLERFEQVSRDFARTSRSLGLRYTSSILLKKKTYIKLYLYRRSLR